MSLLSLSLRLTTLWIFLNCVSAYDCPLPECDSCLPPKVRKAPGVGFELTTSYGTSSVHHYNGSKSNIAHIPASPAYLDLLGDLSLSSKPPKPSTFQRYLRRLNKRLGRPATKDVDTLSELLSSLRAVTEARLGQNLDRVVVTTPQFPALTRGDLEDAIEYAGLRSWLEYPLPYPTALYAPNAAYAANGHGLCKESENLYACLEEAEEGELPLEQVYAVTFTDATLHTSVTRINYAFSRDPDSHISAPELGLSHLDSYPSSSGYWAEVFKHLQLLPQKVADEGRPVSALVLLGENADMTVFRKILKDAMSGSQKLTSLLDPKDIDAIQSDTSSLAGTHIEGVANPLWAAAQGAAMYARWRQEVPWDCLESKTCKNEQSNIEKNESQSPLGENVELKR
ncbi:MAG: hypothetical protein Q9166_007583 [cf. Caloplaca sp. 2 TL-2023]